MTIADVLTALTPFAPLIGVMVAAQVALTMMDRVVGWFREPRKPGGY